jgi:hypothetical protein
MATYSSAFRMKRAYSMDLHNDKELLEELKANGFKYIRRYDNRSFNILLRNPTMGCIVELYQIHYYNCVPIDSPAGKKLISRLCYF